MIGYVKGKVRGIEGDSAIVDVHGVGYVLHCSANTLGSLDGETELFVHTHVREDDISLFGFLTITEKKLFLSLLKVNGVGPKLALNILSGARVEKVVEMIEEENVKGLCSLPKVGKKTAEQMILSLKGKLPKEETSQSVAKSSSRKEIVSALVNLGFRINDVELVVETLPEETSVEDGVRRGLRELSQI
jgi:holliday junction DNA helicase RuvA